MPGCSITVRGGHVLQEAIGDLFPSLWEEEELALCSAGYVCAMPF